MATFVARLTQYDDDGMLSNSNEVYVCATHVVDAPDMVTAIKRCNGSARKQWGREVRVFSIKQVVADILPHTPKTRRKKAKKNVRTKRSKA